MKGMGVFFIIIVSRGQLIKVSRAVKKKLSL